MQVDTDDGTKCSLNADGPVKGSQNTDDLSTRQPSVHDSLYVGWCHAGRRLLTTFTDSHMDLGNFRDFSGSLTDSATEMAG